MSDNLSNVAAVKKTAPKAAPKKTAAAKAAPKKTPAKTAAPKAAPKTAAAVPFVIKNSHRTYKFTVHDDRKDKGIVSEKDPRRPFFVLRTGIQGGLRLIARCETRAAAEARAKVQAAKYTGGKK